MFETIRKAMYFGLGAATMSRDRVQHIVDDLVARGEVTTEEGRKLYEEFSARAEEEGKATNERLRAQVRGLLKEIGVVERSEFAMLENRVRVLEQRLEELTEVKSEVDPPAV